MKIKFICLVLCLLTLLSSCKSPTPLPKQTFLTLEHTNTESLEKKQYAYTLKEFDVGEGTYESPAGVKMPFHVNGIIGLPEGDGPFPLVLITHGSHSNDNEKLRFDTGYDYLVKTLAKQGIVTVSMDMSKAYIWKYGDNDDREKSIYLAMQHIKHLTEANQGKSQAYPVSLSGKIDFDRIALAGHSRGGETIFDIAQELNQAGLPVTSLLCIAPTYQFTDRTWPEGSVALIIPEYDGDVISLDGFSLYDTLNQQTSGEHLAVYLKNANHNYFNRNIKRNDAKMLASSRDISSQMTRRSQEKFLQLFASDFFFRTLQNKEPLLPADKPQPDTMYGENVAVRYQTPQSKPIFLAKAASEYTAQHMTAEIKTDAWFFKLDELLADTVTHGDGEDGTRKLLKLSWSETPATFGFVPEISDWQAYKSLILDLVVDPSDENNAHLEYQRFTVRLTDSKGDVSDVTLPDRLEVLKKASGSMDSTSLPDETIYFWSIPTPLSSLIIPLNAFEGIVLSEIKRVDLVFDGMVSGSVLLEDLRIQ